MTEYEKYCARRGDLTTDELYPPEAYPPELAPCPFCGNVCRRTDEAGRINLQSVRVDVTMTKNPMAVFCHEVEPRYYVKCYKCFASGGARVSPAEAVKAWQMRA